MGGVGGGGRLGGLGPNLGDAHYIDLSAGSDALELSLVQIGHWPGPFRGI